MEFAVHEIAYALHAIREDLRASALAAELAFHELAFESTIIRVGHRAVAMELSIQETAYVCTTTRVGIRALTVKFAFRKLAAIHVRT